MSDKKIKVSLGVKLFTLITILILFTAVAVTGFVIRQKQTEHYNTLIDKGFLTSNFIAELSEFGVFSENEEFLGQIIKKLNDPEIAYIAILRNDLSILADQFYGNNRENLKTLTPVAENQRDSDLVRTSIVTLNKKEHLQFIAPIVSASRSEFDPFSIEGERPVEQADTLGYVRLVYSQEKINAATKKAVRTVGFVTLAIVVVSLFLTIVLIRRILLPVNRLVQGTRSIASGDLDTFIDVTANDELGVLAYSFNDMTDQLRNSREELDQYHKTLEKEVTDRTADLLKEKEKAEKANRAKSDFLAMVSHEIRTPLNAVVGMTDVLLTTDLSDIQQHYTQTIQSSSEILLSLINNILIFSKLDAGKLFLDISDFSVREIAEDAAHILTEQAFKKGLELYCNVPVDLADGFEGDPDRIKQVLVNLISNAIKFTECGEVELLLSVEEESNSSTSIRFEVRDTGIGVEPEKQDAIFNAFVQADGTTTREYGGTGLGLSISKGLVELMGGTINLESLPGKGSRFWFILDLKKHQQIKPLTVEITEASEEKKILIVDPHAMSREVLAKQLSYWHFQCDIVSHGKDALHSLRDSSMSGTPFMWALINCHLPDMDSFELIYEIRRDRKISFIRLIMLSAAFDEVTPKLITECDLDNYLIKPVRQGKLYEALELTGTPSVPMHSEADSKTEKREKNIKADARILLVEDNLTNREVATSMLEILGYEVTAVENGLEAVEMVTSNPPFDLILMDCQMPVMDGFESARKIRDFEEQNTGNVHVPIVALTGNVQEGVEEECLSAGMDDYLSKPFVMETLQGKLSAWLK